ncbi:unnamed protein product [Adineta steineri]|uniref:Mono(ADP-ribosyl)transferase n=1 Tax=Adineta steineri TaxID=433720 RepID=A0A815Q291_9BILA|nr:unnamed protein product [Adineta steineri]CAF4107095.1 unnamed protein product [Adineta steineri]
MAAKFSDEPQQVFRFSDFPSEPRQMLSPIIGYEKEPLVSLEEAIDPLIPLVPEVERMAWTVKQRHFDGNHDLTDDEVASIILYTMEWEPTENSFYITLNKTLQAANRKLLKPWFLYLRLIMTSLAKLPSDSNRLTVYRGVKLDLSAQYPKGTTVTWWSFSSCTTSIDVLSNEQFLGNGLHIIQLKEIQPKFPLINPVPQPTLHSPIPPIPQSTPLPDPSAPPITEPTLLPDLPIPSITKPTPLPALPIPSITKPTPLLDLPKPLQPPKCNNPKLQKYIDAMYLDQTLTTLDLQNNQVGDEGAQDLANALQINKTLTILDLGCNQIGAKGVKHLADALQINKVTPILVLIHLHCTSSFAHISYRHLPHSTSKVIDSVIKEQHVLPMLYELTR